MSGLLRATHLIIWDEITMQHRHAAEAVDRTLRDIRNTNKPFGGIPVVFGGDFQQILPVVPRGQREDIVGASLSRSSLWLHTRVLRLTVNMRLAQDSSPEAQEFAKWLLDVGHGRNSIGESGEMLLPAYMNAGNLDALIQYIYGDIGTHTDAPPPSHYFLNRIILSARNDDVDEVNSHVLSLMPGSSRTYVSADTVLGPNGEENTDFPIPVEFLRSIRSSGLPPGELSLKKGCPIIILRNLSPSSGVCNGARATILNMSDRVLEVQLVGGPHDGEIVMIPRISVVPSDSQGEFSFTLKRRQFPVNLAFAMTINKSQGQSVKYVGVDLRSPVFTHGQLYVALSRATSGRHIRVVLPDGNTTNTTTNIVYPEVLVA